MWELNDPHIGFLISQTTLQILYKSTTIYGILIKAGNRLVIKLFVFFLYSGGTRIKANKGKYCFVRVSGWIIGIRLPFLKLHC